MNWELTENNHMYALRNFKPQGISVKKGDLGSLIAKHSNVTQNSFAKNSTINSCDITNSYVENCNLKYTTIENSYVTNISGNGLIILDHTVSNYENLFTWFNSDHIIFMISPDYDIVLRQGQVSFMPEIEITELDIYTTYIAKYHDNNFYTVWNVNEKKPVNNIKLEKII